MGQTFSFSTGKPMRHRTIVVLAIALVAAACQKKAQGQTVAIVNNEEITAGELNAALASDSSVAGSDPKVARAAELQKLVDRKILVQQAKSDGLDKSPDFLNQQRTTTEDILINMLVSRQANTAQVPSVDEINRFEASRPQMFANREIWTLQQILYPLPKDQALVAKIAAANSIDEVAQVLTASGVQFTRGSKQIDTAIFPPAIYAVHRSWCRESRCERNQCTPAGASCWRQGSRSSAECAAPRTDAEIRSRPAEESSNIREN
jgi:peptidyl-prolyl cis-trans isomerase C